MARFSSDWWTAVSPGPGPGEGELLGVPAGRQGEGQVTRLLVTWGKLRRVQELTETRVSSVKLTRAGGEVAEHLRRRPPGSFSGALWYCSYAPVLPLIKARKAGMTGMPRGPPAYQRRMEAGSAVRTGRNVGWWGHSVPRTKTRSEAAPRSGRMVLNQRRFATPCRREGKRAVAAAGPHRRYGQRHGHSPTRDHQLPTAAPPARRRGSRAITTSPAVMDREGAGNEGARDETLGQAVR